MTKKTTGKINFNRCFARELELVFARPLERIACRQMKLLLKPSCGLRHESSIVRVFKIDVNVSGQCAVFIANHRRTTREVNPRYLSERNLRSRRRSNQNAEHLLGRIAEMALIPHIDRIPFAPFDILRDVLSADAGSNRPSARPRSVNP